ncbi:MAG: DNA repair protein rad50, partial [Watsoniomyces obsoletus]
VVEMDLILPQYLGVSTAVIDNVIFCHQEESLWPMSDSSTLKKKFDEIFEAQKYTKAIKNIRDIGKEKKQELNEYKIHEQNAKIDKDRAKKAEKRSS